MNTKLRLPKFEVLDCPIQCGDEIEFRDHLIEVLSEQHQVGGGYSIAINAEKIYKYNKNTDLRNTIDSSTLQYVDGSAAVIGLRMLHGISAKKIDFPNMVLKLCNERQFRLFIAGSTEANLQLAVDYIKHFYPFIQLVGFCDGYKPESVIADLITKSNADLVMLAMGSPKQEKFAKNMIDLGAKLFFVGVGGAIDIMSGQKSRAPSWMINGHLEWFYRLVKEPWRIKRMNVLPKVMIALIIYYLLKKNILTQKT